MAYFEKAGNLDDIPLGSALISGGKVGCIALAGGDGSRLGWKGPKGNFPISLVKQKTLFQLLYERAQTAADHFGSPLHLAVMSSPLNDETTRKAFPKGVEFFQQGMLPLLDREKNPMEERRPNGNGEVLKYFVQSGIYEKWKRAGVEYVQVVLIDNPLADPLDPNQIGIHYKRGADISLKVVDRKSPMEKVGVIGEKEGKVAVIEYMENPKENPKNEGELANTSLFCFSMPFIEKVHNQPLPLHCVEKVIRSNPVYKQEAFIFDLLPKGEKVVLIHYLREKTFAPLKSSADIGSVQRALLNRDRHAFSELTGRPVEQKIFELHPRFHFSTDALREKWKGKGLPKQAYIDV